MFSLYFLIALSPFFKHLCWAQQKSFLIKEHFNLTLQGEKASISTADCLKHWKSAFLAMGKLSSKHWHGKEVFPQAQELMESGGFSPVFKCLMWSESCYSFPSERTKCPYHSASMFVCDLFTFFKSVLCSPFCAIRLQGKEWGLKRWGIELMSVVSSLSPFRGDRAGKKRAEKERSDTSWAGQE